VNPSAWRLPTRLAAAVLSGGLLLLAFPPFEISWVALGGLVPLLMALHGAKGKTGFLVGLVHGAVFVGVLVLWISYFGYLAWGALIFEQALFFAVFGWFAAWASTRGAGRLLAVPLMYVALEILRTRWPLGGFSWGDLGYSQADAGPMLPLARVGGVHLITLALVAINALVAILLTNGRVWKRALAVVVAGGIAAGPIALPLGLAGRTGEQLDVALIQGNVPEGRFTGFADRVSRQGPEDLSIIANHVVASETLIGHPPDLVVWPENAVDRDPFTHPEVGTTISDTVREVGAPFIVGAIIDVPTGGFQNSNLLYGPDGGFVRRYDKLHLVPFGEYVPWPSLRRYVKALEQIPEDGIPGVRPIVFDVNGVKVGAVICFESTYPQLVEQFVNEGAEVLIVSTNNASFRRSPAARQHVQMSRLRAVEEGRVVLHTAISGITAVIDARGRVLQRTHLFQPAIVRRTVPLAAGRTPYERFGEAIELGMGGLGAAAGILAFAGVLGRRRERRYEQAERDLWGETTGEPAQTAENTEEATPAPTTVPEGKPEP